MYFIVWKAKDFYLTKRDDKYQNIQSFILKWTSLQDYSYVFGTTAYVTD